MRSIFLAAALVVAAPSTVHAPAPEPPLPPDHAKSPELHDGMAPGMKATELSPKVRIFRLVFSKGDDVAAGLAEFAKKNRLTDAHFSAIGAFGAAVIGWSDRPGGAGGGGRRGGGGGGAAGGGGGARGGGPGRGGGGGRAGRPGAGPGAGGGSGI